MHRLSKSPDLQRKLRKELSVFGLCAGNDIPIPESRYEKMTMLNAILNEMMRLEPPLPITLRKTVRNTTVGTQAVNAGTYIVISPYAMGRSQAIWGPNAAVFDPHRWILPHEPSHEATVSSLGVPMKDDQADESIELVSSPHGRFQERGDSLRDHRYGMLTFLKGAKGCTGEQFAKAELRRVIAAMVAEFEWVCAQANEPEQTGIVVVSDLCTNFRKILKLDLMPFVI